MTSFAFTPEGQRCGSSVASTYDSGINCSNLPSGATGYAYNSFGELCWVGTTTTGSAGACGSTSSTSTEMSYDGNGLLSSATTPSTSLHYTFDTQSSVPLMLSDGSNDFVYGPLLFGSTAPIEQINGSTASFCASTPSGVQAVFQGGSARRSRKQLRTRPTARRSSRPATCQLRGCTRSGSTVRTRCLAARSTLITATTTRRPRNLSVKTLARCNRAAICVRGR